MNKYQLSQSTLEKIWYYVYVLVDPRDWLVFYVWKWKGNRINQHILWNFKEDKKETEKNKRIDEIMKSWIEIKQIIVRHWLASDDDAFKIECAIIDLYLWNKRPLTNIVKWHWSEETWIMDLEDIKIKYEAEDAIFDNDKIILININSLYRKNMTYEEIYEATRKSWIIAPKRANNATTLCAVYKWIIREVFEINKSREIDQARCQKHPWEKTRYMFTWRLSQEEIRNKYLNKSVKGYWKQWAQMPIKYVNC